MNKNTIKKKMFLILAGIISAIFLIEILLVCSSKIYSVLHLAKYNKEELDSSYYKILCLGDSFTYGLGADLNNSYPAQLKQILNNKIKYPALTVYNLGRPGINSSQLVNEAEKNIEIFNPDIIIVTIGDNDGYNFKNVEWQGTWQGVKSKILYSNLRIFNLIFHMFKKNNIDRIYDVNQLIFWGNFYRERYLYKKAEMYYLKALLIAPDNKNVLLELGRSYQFNGEYEKALKIFKKTLSLFPDDIQIFGEIDSMFFRTAKFEDAVALYEQLLKENPNNKFINEQLVHSKAGAKNHSIKLSRQNGLKNLSINFIINNFFKKTEIQTSVANKILRNNLNKMADICKKYNILLLFSGYPDYTSRAMQEVSGKKQIILINHQETFSNLLKETSYNTYFVSEFDHHCTNEGYRIMAENIAVEIFKHQLIKKDY